MEDRGVQLRQPRGERKNKKRSKHRVVLGVEVEETRGHDTKRSHTEYDADEPDTNRSHNFVKVGLDGDKNLGG